MDEEDGQVLPHEAEAERKARAEAIENFQMDKELALMKNGNSTDFIYQNYSIRKNDQYFVL